MSNLAQKLNELEKKIKTFTPDPKYPHDPFIKITLEKSIAAAKEGNYGVGAILVDKNGKIVLKGHNKLFKPYSRSDLHAEMDLLNQFEDKFKGEKSLKDFTLYVPFDPCPMCLCRLIFVGISRVYFPIFDTDGGGVQILNKLPLAWKKMAKNCKFELVPCSLELKKIADFLLNKTWPEDQDLWRKIFNF